jgi:peptidyl-prolyl cis-trans isomerase B (cyclophilin B)
MSQDAIQAVFKTSLGEFKIELDAKNAPITVENIVAYIRAGFYDNTIFHRVISGFVIQGGGFDPSMTQKRNNAPIKNEASNGLKNLRGTLSMARTSDPDSATSQFFINLVDNAFLNPSPGNAGYAVFGKVVEGMEVIDKVAKVKTGRSGHHSDVPVEPVVVESVQVVEG